MEVHIDYRERELIKIFENEKLINFSIKNLDTADIIICKEEKPIFYIERKTAQDFSASIKDGRYKEQKLRLLSSVIHNAQVIYIIENFDKNLREICGIENYKLCQAFSNMFVRDGIFTYFTENLQDTYAFIKFLINSLIKYNFIYLQDDIKNKEDYTETISPIKKENITPKFCFISQLCCIPRISRKKAQEIATLYSTMELLINELKTNDIRNVKNIQCGKQKLGQKSAENIKIFLGLI